MTAAQLRAAGIDSPGVHDDEDLETATAFMLESGFTLDQLTRGEHFMDLLLMKLLRPDADHDPAPLVGESGEFANRLRVAMGFPALNDPQTGTPVRLTSSERETAEFFNDLAVVFGDDEVLGLLRVMSSSAARVARAVTSLLRLQFDTPLNDAGRLTPALEGYSRLIGSALPHFDNAGTSLLRSHFALLAQSEREWTVDQSRTAALEEVVIGFADLVGFTAFTEKANAEQFMRAMVGFEEDVQAAVVDNGGTLVKLIGDEVMFAAPDAPAGLRIAEALSEVGRRSGDLEGMRVGLSSGEVINSGGDYFGTVVNVAARIVNLAFTHAIVVTDAVASALEFSVPSESLGFHTLRGISAPVELFRLRP